MSFSLNRFDVHWLKNQSYHTPQGIKSDPSLSEKEKRYLLGIHTRNNNCARNPSSMDIKILEAAYSVEGLSIHIVIMYALLQGQ